MKGGLGRDCCFNGENRLMKNVAFSSLELERSDPEILYASIRTPLGYCLELLSLAQKPKTHKSDYNIKKSHIP